MQTTINIVNNIIISKTNIRVLKLQIDTTLKWDSHVKKIQKKKIKQSLTLTKISTLTWSASFIRTRYIYTAVMRSTLIFDLIVWHTFRQLKRAKSIENKFAIIQNRCFRTVIEIYKATAISILETKTHISLIAIQLNRFQRNARQRLAHCSNHIKKFCKTIAKKFREARERRKNVDFTSSTRKTIWVILLIKSYQKSLILIFFWKMFTKN